jgi:hypothetical protein
LLARYGDLDGLRDRADIGDEYAYQVLADLLVEQGDLDGRRRSCVRAPTPTTGTLCGGW